MFFRHSSLRTPKEHGAFLLKFAQRNTGMLVDEDKALSLIDSALLDRPSPLSIPDPKHEAVDYWLFLFRLENALRHSEGWGWGREITSEFMASACQINLNAETSIYSFPYHTWRKHCDLNVGSAKAGYRFLSHVPLMESFRHGGLWLIDAEFTQYAGPLLQHDSLKDRVLHLSTSTTESPSCLAPHLGRNIYWQWCERTLLQKGLGDSSDHVEISDALMVAKAWFEYTTSLYTTTWEDKLARGELVMTPSNISAVLQSTSSSELFATQILHAIMEKAPRWLSVACRFFEPSPLQLPADTATRIKEGFVLLTSSTYGGLARSLWSALLAEKGNDEYWLKPTAYKDGCFPLVCQDPMAASPWLTNKKAGEKIGESGGSLFLLFDAGQSITPIAHHIRGESASLKYTGVWSSKPLLLTQPIKRW